MPRHLITKGPMEKLEPYTTLVKAHGKFAAAALTCGLIAVQQAVPMSRAARAALTVALAALGAAAVYQIRNTAPGSPRRGDPPH